MNQAPRTRVIVDAHQHFWRKAGHGYGLLQQPLMQRRFGAYAAIARDYLPEDYRADIGDTTVAATIHVEAGFLGPPIEETRWLAELNSRTGLPTAALVSLDYRAGNIAAQIAAHEKAAGDLQIVGVRQHAHWSTDARFTGTKDPAILRDPLWGEAVHAAVAEGWCVEIPIFFNQSDDLARLVEKEPEGRFVLGHAALPVHFDASPIPFDDPIAGWQKSISDLSRYENLSVKLSGFWMSGSRLSAEQLSSLVTCVIDHFGEDRIVFGSNFPIDRLQISFSQMCAMFEEALDDHGETAKDNFFAQNALRIYRMNA